VVIVLYIGLWCYSLQPRTPNSSCWLRPVQPFRWLQSSRVYSTL